MKKGYKLLINTSLNVYGNPIVYKPDNVIR